MFPLIPLLIKEAIPEADWMVNTPVLFPLIPLLIKEAIIVTIATATGATLSFH